MKRKMNKLTRVIIFNALFLALTVVITINLLVTGGKPAAPQATPALTQTTP